MNPAEAQTLTREIQNLRDKLNNLNQKKEESFKEYQNIKSTLSKKISESKKVHSDSKNSKSEVSTLKKKRDEHNTKVKTLIETVKKLHNQKKDLFEKHNIKGDISSVKKSVQVLQLKLETEALSFSEEKKLMKKIKSLESLYKGGGKLGDVMIQIDEISKQIDTEKTKADEFHKKLVEESKGSKFDSFIKLSKEIVDLKKNQKNAFDEFKRTKDSFHNINEILKEKLDKATQIKTMIDTRKKDFVKPTHKKEKPNKLDLKLKKVVEEKQKMAEEKLKKGEKLTTEDLLAMQSVSD